MTRRRRAINHANGRNENIRNETSGGEDPYTVYRIRTSTCAAALSFKLMIRAIVFDAARPKLNWLASHSRSESTTVSLAHFVVIKIGGSGLGMGEGEAGRPPRERIVRDRSPRIATDSSRFAASASSRGRLPPSLRPADSSRSLARRAVVSCREELRS